MAAHASQASRATYREKQEEPTGAGAIWLVLLAPALLRSTLLHPFSKLRARESTLHPAPTWSVPCLMLLAAHGDAIRFGRIWR